MSDVFAVCPIPGLPETTDGRQYWPCESSPEAGHDGRRGSGRVNLTLTLTKGQDAQAVFLKWESGKINVGDWPIHPPAGAILAEFVGTWDRRYTSGYQAIAGAAIPGPLSCETVDGCDVVAEFQQRKPWRSWVVLVPKE